MFKNVSLILLPLCIFVAPFSVAASTLEEVQPLYCEKPQASTAAGLSPVCAKDMEFHLVTTIMCDALDKCTMEEGKLDISCVFGADNRAKKVKEDGECEEEIFTECFTYTKTGPNTAFVRYWSGFVTPDGDERGGSVCEAHLTFTAKGKGCVKYVTYGHGFDTYGAANFTLVKK